MVCLGNICRSPLAEGVLAKLLLDSGSDYFVDSAGTSGLHAGESPDSRSIRIAEKHSIHISKQKARKIQLEDFRRFDLILAMDLSVFNDIVALAEAADQQKIHLFLDFAEMGRKDVPDPWYGEMEDFRTVYDLIARACDKIRIKLLKNRD